MDHRVKPGDDDGSVTPKRSYPSPSSLANTPFTALAHPASLRCRVVSLIAGLKRRSSRQLSANLAGSGYGVTYTGNNFNPCNVTTQSCAWGSDVVGWVDFSYAFPLCTADTKQECTGAGLQTISSTTIDMYCNITTKNTDTCSLPGKCLDGSSECVYPPPDFLISATPLLVNSGATTTISWGSNGGGDVVGLKNCNVTTNPNNGDSWSGLSGSKTSSPIKQVIVYTLACKSVDPLDPNTYGGSVRVGIVPRFHEH